jgi:hypothetical protein
MGSCGKTRSDGYLKLMEDEWQRDREISEASEGMSFLIPLQKNPMSPPSDLLPLLLQAISTSSDFPRFPKGNFFHFSF